MGRFSWMRGAQEPEPEPEPESDPVDFVYIETDLDENPESEPEPAKPYEDGEWWMVVVTMLGGGKNKNLYTFSFGRDESYNGMKEEALKLATRIMPDFHQPQYPWISEDGLIRINRNHIVSVAVDKKDRNDLWA